MEMLVSFTEWTNHTPSERDLLLPVNSASQELGLSQATSTWLGS
jgi:hypothetical protein